MSKSDDSTAAIMSEQLKLVYTERELSNMIDIVNAHLNQLLVEELHLQSSDLSSGAAAGSPVYPVALSAAETTSTAELALKLDSSVDINQQQLDLGGELIVDGSAPFSMQVCDEGELESEEEEDDDEL